MVYGEKEFTMCQRDMMDRTKHATFFRKTLAHACNPGPLEAGRLLTHKRPATNTGIHKQTEKVRLYMTYRLSKYFCSLFSTFCQIIAKKVLEAHFRNKKYLEKLFLLQFHTAFF